MHKGIMMQAVRVTGQAGHSSNPALGNSALEAMHTVMAELLSFRQDLQARYSNPLFDIDYPTLNLGCIHGGDSPNRICGRTELHFDLRMTPNGNNEEARAEVEKRLQGVAKKHSIDISLDSLVKHIPPFEQSADSELVTLAESLTGHTASAVAFATEAPFLQQLGMETIVMGPGSIDRAHQPDEYMELEQMRPCVSLLQSFIERYCL
jgi:acetylornithine deacetylase